MGALQRGAKAPRTPVDHYIPQSLLKGFVTASKGVARWRRDGTFEEHKSVRDTASVAGGNTVNDRHADYLFRSEPYWTAAFDNEIGRYARIMREARWASTQFVRAARSLIPRAVCLPYRTPSFAAERLGTGLGLHHVLGDVGDASLERYVEALAEHLTIDPEIIERLGLPHSELRHIALDRQGDDLALLDDLAKGPFAMALVASRQWEAAAPLRVEIQRAPEGHCFQIADCGVIAFRCVDGGRRPMRHTWIWDDEDARTPPQTDIHAVTVTVTVSCSYRIHASFDPDRVGLDCDRISCCDADESAVRAHNEMQFRMAEAFVYGDPC